MISAIVSSQHRRLALKLIATYQPHSSLDIAMALGYSLLLCTLGISVTGATLLAINDSTVAQMPLGERTDSQVNVLFVNPNMGNDSTGNGSDRTPFQTITKALQVATGNTVIMLAPGTYSPETGEEFPLILKAGVSIQGDASNKGRDIKIQGGGTYLSRSFGGQNVAIVGANQAALTGVTIINSNPRGYGLWIESSNPVISENTFIGSTQDGVAVTGNGAPTISKNYFYRNGANGITLSGTSLARVQENIFQETGFGVNITQNAAPVVMGNQIQNNRVGIIVQGKARPILRNNLIEGNKEDGLVAIAQATPNLGTLAEAGGNEFRNNARYDINASTAKQAIAAAGNTLIGNGSRVIGKVDFNAQNTAITDNPQPTTPNQTISAIPSRIGVANTANPVTTSLNKPTLPQSNQLLSPPPGGFPTSNPQTTPTATVTPQLNYVQIDTNTIEFVAPNAVTQPSTDVISLGNTTTLNPTPKPQNSQTNTTGNTRYRVIVEVANEKEQQLVRFLVPGAFSTIWQGRKVMQAGVFSSRSNADEMSKTLMNNRLRTIIEPLN